MSHIPSHAMPHAKAHDDEHGAAHEEAQGGATPQAAPEAPTPPPVPADKAEGGEKPPFPWVAAAIGGAVLAGGATAAALLLGKKGKPAKPKLRHAPKKGPRKPKADKPKTEAAAKAE